MSNLDARLGAFAALVGASLDLDRVVDHVVTAVRDLLSTDRVTVWIRDEHTDEIHRLARAATAAEPGSRSRFRVGVGVVGWVVANNAPYYSPNVATDERYADKAEAKSAGYRSVFGVPLSSGDHAIGALTVMTRAEHGFTEEDRRLISLFAVHTATAMEHARLFQHAQQRAQRLAALAAVTRLITSASEPDAVHTAICQAAITLLGAKMVHVWVDEPARSALRLASHHGPEASPTLAHGQGVAGRVFETRTPEVIDDIQTHDAWVHKHLIEGLHTCLAWPLVAGDHGRGALMVLFAERRPITQEERELVDVLADHAAIAIEKEARLAEQRSQSRELALKTQRLEALRRVSLMVASSPTEEAVFTAITAAAVELCGDAASSLWVHDPEAQTVTLVADHGLKFSRQRARNQMRVGEGLVGQVVATAQPEIVDDAQQDPRLVNRAMTQAESFHATLTVPLLFAGRCVGALSVRRRTFEPFSAEDQELLGSLAQHAAITIERARLYREAQAQQRQLQEISQMKSDFVAFVTHQLRTPLAGIKWMLELGVSEPDVPPGVLEYIRNARLAAERLIALVNDLLDASRLEAGVVTAEKQPVDLEILTHAVLAELAGLVAEKQQAVSVETDGPLVVPGDPQLLRQVVLNLLSNAVKYTPPSGRITVRLGRQDGEARWSVTDTGIGIPAAAQAHLFEKFYRADNVVTLETEGTGLGLYLVRLILERSGGRIWCESVEGTGSTFSFALPHTPA